MVSLSITGIPAMNFDSSIGWVGTAGTISVHSIGSGFLISTPRGVPPMLPVNVARLLSRFFLEKER